MANNIISRELLEQCKRLNDGQSCEICNNFAKKLDRLVEAAREAKSHLATSRHNPFCAINTGGNCDCTLTATRNSLTAALREIELKGEHGEQYHIGLARNLRSIFGHARTGSGYALRCPTRQAGGGGR